MKVKGERRARKFSKEKIGLQIGRERVGKEKKAERKGHVIVEREKCSVQLISV